MPERVAERAFATGAAANPDVGVWLTVMALALGGEPTVPSDGALENLRGRLGEMGSEERAAFVEALVVSGGAGSRDLLAELLPADLSVSFDFGGVAMSTRLGTLAAHALARFGDGRSGEPLLVALSNEADDDAFVAAHGLAILPADRERQDAVAHDDRYVYPTRILCAVASLRMGWAAPFVDVAAVDEREAFFGYAWVDPQVREAHFEMLPPLAEAHARVVEQHRNPDAPGWVIDEILAHLRPDRDHRVAGAPAGHYGEPATAETVQLAEAWITALGADEGPERLDGLSESEGQRLAREGAGLDPVLAGAVATAVAAATALRRTESASRWDAWLFGEFLPATAPLVIDAVRLMQLVTDENRAQLAWVLSRGQLDAVLDQLVDQLADASVERAVLIARLLAAVAVASGSDDAPYWGGGAGGKLALPPETTPPPDALPPAAAGPEVVSEPPPPAAAPSLPLPDDRDGDAERYRPSPPALPAPDHTLEGGGASGGRVGGWLREAFERIRGDDADAAYDDPGVSEDSGAHPDTVEEDWDDGESAATGDAVTSVPPGGEDPRDLRRVRVGNKHSGVDRNTVIAGGLNRLTCWIGPGKTTGSGIAREPIVEPAEVPDEGLPLEVVLEGVDARLPTRLPPAPGSTRPVTFDFVGPAADVGFERRLTFLHEGAILESVVVRADVVTEGQADTVGQQIEVIVEADLRGRLELTAREPRAAAVLDLGETSEIVVFGPTGTPGARVDLDLPDVTAAFAAQLFGAATSLVRAADKAGQGHKVLEVDDQTTRELLVKLAQNGATLHRHLAQQDFGAAADVIQVVSVNNERYLPLELVYERGFPSDEATVNAECVEALRTDVVECPHCKPTAKLTARERNLAETVCPFGWWATSRRFERLLLTRPEIEDLLAHHDLPTDRNATLSPITSALAGLSKRVRDEDADAFETELTAIAPVAVVDSWVEWLDYVDAEKPPLLVALAHQLVQDKLERLEIGGTDPTLASGQPLELYVTGGAESPGPVVVMLGCESDGSTTLGYQSFARAFAHSGASIVVGTLSKVLGRHAVPVTVELVRRLAAAPGGKPFSRVLLDSRRAMFADGYLMALAVIALGDADWITP